MEIKKNINIFQLFGKTSLLEFSIYLLVLLIFVLNEGIALMRFPLIPLPLGEVILAIAIFIYLAIDKSFFNQIKNSKYTLPYIILLSSTFFGVVFNFEKYGLGALRTATHIVDLSALFIGIKYSQSKFLRSFHKRMYMDLIGLRG